MRRRRADVTTLALRRGDAAHARGDERRRVLRDARTPFLLLFTRHRARQRRKPGARSAAQGVTIASRRQRVPRVEGRRLVSQRRTGSSLSRQSADRPLAVARVSERDGFAPIIEHRPRGILERQEHPLRHHAAAVVPSPARARPGGVAEIRAAPRVLTLMACLNTIGAACGLFYGRAIATQELNDEPVFILGHPRTGTPTCTTYCRRIRGSRTPQPSASASRRASSVRRLAPYLGLIMDAKRPMDNMALAWDTPQEDEIAVNQLSAGASPYMRCVSPAGARFRKFYDFRRRRADLTRMEGRLHVLPQEDAVRRGGSHKRLLLKSPVHTARVRILREMFPKAQFVFIHRHPLEGVSVRRAHGGRVLLAVSSPETDVTGHAGVHSASGASCCTRRTTRDGGEVARNERRRFDSSDSTPTQSGRWSGCTRRWDGGRRSTACDPSSSGIGTVWRILR